MKVPFSDYLTGIAPAVKRVIDDLKKDHDYVSALCTDSKGLVIRIGSRARSISNKTMTTERGVVFRVCKDKKYSEYAVNNADWNDTASIIKRIRENLSMQDALLAKTGSEIFETDVLDDEPLTFFGEKETGSLPEKANIKELADKLIAISDKGMKMGENVIECMANAQSTHISKMFLTKNRDLRQSYVYSEGMMAVVVRKGDKVNEDYKSVSGIKGPELFDELEAYLPTVVKNAEELLDAEPIEPGEYEIITSPEVTGLIAHEAFGHGVEMDMFVKDRALAKSVVGEYVASPLVTMHDGNAIDQTATYFFDDEGTLSEDTVIIDKGVLVRGMCDMQSAMALNAAATGNGRRESYKRKAYTRMTNTYFEAGTDKLEDMIASIKYGFLLENPSSGMEDPKNWGIQMMVNVAREIKDGKLTGKVFSPIVMTGYVPTLLKSISMVSDKAYYNGSGFCGKGYKEYVKVSDGGPYIKAKIRLG